VKPANGAAQESNLPSLGQPDLTSFEDAADSTQLSRFRPMRASRRATWRREGGREQRRDPPASLPDAMIMCTRRRRMSTTTEVFADVDRMDAKAFASYLAEDCLLRFANADEVVGRDAIEEAIAGFFSTIKGLSHHIVEQWEVDDTTIVQLEATYTRMDDRRVTLPAVTIYRRGGDLIDEYRIYIDLAPIYA
jgi:ketosteroid isomerase-like protein